MATHTWERSTSPRLRLGPFLVHYLEGPQRRQQEFRLRFRAFVEERGWERPARSGDALEQDEFDEFCCSALLTDEGSGEVVACQRLILPDRLPDSRRTNAERQYRPLSGAPGLDLTSAPRARWAEASRLTIARPFRCGRGLPLSALLGISYATAALAAAADRQALFTVSDPRMSALTRRMGFELRRVGEFVAFHGRRAVYQIDVEEVLHSVRPEWQDAVRGLVAGARTAVAAGDSRRAADTGHHDPQGGTV